MTKYRYFYPKTSIVASLALTMLAGSCSASQTDTTKDRKQQLQAVETQSTIEPMQLTDAPTPIREMKKMTKQEQILHSRQDLAKRLELELDEVSLSGATPVRWRSGAMGCPKPGMEYTQALLKGVLIMLRVGNTAYRYHAIPAGEPFYCPDSQAEAPYINSSDA